MKLSEIKTILANLDHVTFELENGTLVPIHFHITEVGKTTKNFIDCGGTVRKEELVNFQLWEASDYDHRLAPEKLNKIIALSEKTLEIDDNLEVEVEYKQDTIGKYGVDFNGKNFILTSKATTCLAQENCGNPTQKQKVALAELGQKAEACCTPGGGCC